MNSRNKNNMYDIRPDEIRTEKMNSKQMASIDNILNEDFRAADETSEVKLFSVSEIPWEKIAFPSVEFFLKNYTRDFLNGKNFLFHSNF